MTANSALSITLLTCSKENFANYVSWHFLALLTKCMFSFIIGENTMTKEEFQKMKQELEAYVP